MPNLTLNTIDLLGENRANTSFSITLVASSDAEGAVYGTGGWVSGRTIKRITDGTGTAVVDLASTAEFSIQTHYEITIGEFSAEFTMPETDALLADRLRAEAILVATLEGTGGLSTVATDSTITGDGSEDTPLSVAEPYSSGERSKLAGIPSNAEANVGEEFTQAEKSKLGNIEDSATADQTGSEIVGSISTALGSTDWQTGGTGGGGGGGLASVSSDATLDGLGTVGSPLSVAEPYTDAERSKLAGIPSDAEANVGQEFTQTEKTKLGGISTGAEVNVGEEFTQAEKSKLTGIEPSAKDDQTGSEIVGSINTQLGSSDWQSGGGGGGLSTVATDSTIDGDGSTGTPLSVAEPYTDTERNKLSNIEDSATADQSATEIRDALDGLTGTERLDYSAIEGGPPTNAEQNIGVEFTQAEKQKLGTVDANAEENIGQEFTQGEKTKLGNIEDSATADQTRYRDCCGRRFRDWKYRLEIRASEYRRGIYLCGKTEALWY